jgi:hypothetical protein
VLFEGPMLFEMKYDRYDMIRAFCFILPHR